MIKLGYMNSTPTNGMTNVRVLLFTDDNNYSLVRCYGGTNYWHEIVNGKTEILLNIGLHEPRTFEGRYIIFDKSNYLNIYDRNSKTNRSIECINYFVFSPHIYIFFANQIKILAPINSDLVCVKEIEQSYNYFANKILLVRDDCIIDVTEAVSKIDHVTNLLEKSEWPIFIDKYNILLSGQGYSLYYIDCCSIFLAYINNKFTTLRVNVKKVMLCHDINYFLIIYNCNRIEIVDYKISNLCIELVTIHERAPNIYGSYKTKSAQ